MSTKKIQIIDSLIKTDDTLTKSGIPADAKTVGDMFAALDGIVATDDGTGIITLSVHEFPMAEEGEF